MFEPSLESNATQGKREGNEQSRPDLECGNRGRGVFDYLGCTGCCVRFPMDNFEVMFHIDKEYYTINYVRVQKCSLLTL